MTELAGLLLLGMAGLNYVLRRDVAFPPFLFTALWCVILFLHAVLEQIWRFKIQPLSNTVLLVFTVGALFFTLGGLTTHYYYDARAQDQRRPKLTLRPLRGKRRRTGRDQYPETGDLPRARGFWPSDRSAR